MKRILLTIFSTLLTLAVCSPTVAQSKDLVKLHQESGVLEFVKQNMIGRTLTRESTRKIADGNVESVFSIERSFGDLVDLGTGFSFTEFEIVNQTLYDLDENGKRTGKPVVKNRKYLSRHEFGIRSSTGKYAGFLHSLAQFKDHDVGSVSQLTLELNEDKTELIVKAPLTLYQDCLTLYSELFAKGGETKPGTVQSTMRYLLEDGKLTSHRSVKAYSVDPKTLEITPWENQVEDRVAREK